MKQSYFKVDLSGLEEYKRECSAYSARVGILGGGQVHAKKDGAKGDPLTNAELMLIQMFGSIINNIPPRDPLYQPIITKRKQLLSKLASGAMRAAFEAKDFTKMFKLLGIEAEVIVQEAFETGGFGTWPANAPFTIHGGWMKNKPTGKIFYAEGKGSDQPLINTAQLRRAVSSDVVKKGALNSQSIHGVNL